MSSGLICVHCSANTIEMVPQGLMCMNCGSGFSVVEGIPVLVRNWTEHENAIKDAQAVNPDWYKTEQPAEAISPWRHHLKKRRLYVSRTIESYLKAKGKSRAINLLDLGCGDGTNLSWLASFADHIYGSDYNLLRLTRARHRLPEATFFLADLLDYPAEDDFFEIIFFNHVIEHIEEDVAALQTVQRILKPGGLLVLGTPNEGAWWWQLAYKRDPETARTTDHVHFYTSKTIGGRMTAAGLNVTAVKHLGWGPPDWKLDGQIRKYKFVDDLFEIMGRVLIPKQASSLYLIATKEA